MTKIIFVTGGVCSGIGKGVVAASIGLLMKVRGRKVAALKLDPYLNVDPGTMSPYQHGEVFVTADGAETDLDLGHYERFIGNPLSALSNVTSGEIFADLIGEERRGAKYLGGTIQVVPHVTEQIKASIRRMVEHSRPDIALIEIGGTVGDIEGLPFLEAIRQMRSEFGPSNTLYVHVTLLPYLATSKDLKTKPTQHSVRELRSNGQPPDVIVLRSDYPIEPSILDKVALHCDVRRGGVVPLETADTHYSVPLSLEDVGLGDWIADYFDLRAPQDHETTGEDLSALRSYVSNFANAADPITIGVVGKYVALEDAYLSVKEALVHAAVSLQRKLHLRWIDAESLEGNAALDRLAALDGIVVPGGFGPRGIEGKIAAARYARTNAVPYLGLCLGMQVMCIELARHALDDGQANSTEFNAQTRHPVIDLMPDQARIADKGGTMRRGSYRCNLEPDSLARQAYAAMGFESQIEERHRHRYEFNNAYREALGRVGLRFSGLSPDGNLVEIVELADHPFMLGSQFHPEFQSRPTQPHPLFRRFVQAAIGRTERQRQQAAEAAQAFVEMSAPETDRIAVGKDEAAMPVQD